MTPTPLQTYDPNITWARHTVELTFMQWDYSLKMTAEVGGNCRGYDLMDSAIDLAFDELYDEDEDNAVIYLRRPAEDGNGEDELEVSLDGVDELKSLCVSAVLVKHEKESRQ